MFERVDGCALDVLFHRQGRKERTYNVLNDKTYFRRYSPEHWPRLRLSSRELERPPRHLLAHIYRRLVRLDVRLERALKRRVDEQAKVGHVDA